MPDPTKRTQFSSFEEASELISQGCKKGQVLTITVKREELTAFITYMTRLHSAKLSLLLRAKIGLAMLMVSNRHVLGEPVDEFIEREFGKVKRSKDDTRIVRLH